MSRPSPVPKSSGVYAWYFRTSLPEIPIDACVRSGDLNLLYVGISPYAPPQNGKLPSKQNLFKRIQYHYRGNAAGSTLRLTLGCLLSKQLDIELRRVGSGNRLTFGSGEVRLSEWMRENAYVVWLECAEPWTLEEQLISTLCLPLNLRHNSRSPFYAILSGLRSTARDRARELPVLT